jgi:hypothetical protein
MLKNFNTQKFAILQGIIIMLMFLSHNIFSQNSPEIKFIYKGKIHTKI